jgi:nucleoside-diphosphate kinase
MIQRSLVLMKPDAVKRGIVGEILHRFERVGLKMVAVRMTQASREHAQKHYQKDDIWAKKVGGIRIEECNKFGVDIMEMYGTEDPVEIGHKVNELNFDFLTSGPVLAIVFEGANAVKRIRDLVGFTIPTEAAPGTIRGDFGLDSAYTGMVRKRTVYNFIHASGTPEEAEIEIHLWFKDEEIMSYRMVHEDLYSY